ncbi:MAG: radical SAM protein [Clostridia bacterium]|nr:radical SAM protein [Clostridia bacterium]
MSRHVNIPVFIPHLGCPNSCVFCNQRSITGVGEFDPGSVRDIIEAALATVEPDAECEIAFFGGSFTGIDYDLMISLLEIAHSYVVAGRVRSIRCSTRPDYIDEKILDTLERYDVRVIELGLQSMSDEVLMQSKRGHTSARARHACEMITSRGFSLVGQMMIGLPGSTAEDEKNTAALIAECGATAARIYPTVVFKDTELEYMTCAGEYAPLGLEEAIERSAAAYEILRGHGVDVIRIGLCSSENLTGEDTYFAGPNHPAIGELVKNEYFYKRIKEATERLAPSAGESLTVAVNPSSLSMAIGQKKRNKERLSREYRGVGFEFVVTDTVGAYDIIVEIKGD